MEYEWQHGLLKKIINQQFAVLELVNSLEVFVFRNNVTRYEVLLNLSERNIKALCLLNLGTKSFSFRIFILRNYINLIKVVFISFFLPSPFATPLSRVGTLKVNYTNSFRRKYVRR